MVIKAIDARNLALNSFENSISGEMIRIEHKIKSASERGKTSTTIGFRGISNELIIEIENRLKQHGYEMNYDSTDPREHESYYKIEW